MSVTKTVTFHSLVRQSCPVISNLDVNIDLKYVEWSAKFTGEQKMAIIYLLTWYNFLSLSKVPYSLSSGQIYLCTACTCICIYNLISYNYIMLLIQYTM